MNRLDIIWYGLIAVCVLFVAGFAYLFIPDFITHYNAMSYEEKVIYLLWTILIWTVAGYFKD